MGTAIPEYLGHHHLAGVGGLNHRVYALKIDTFYKSLLSDRRRRQQKTRYQYEQPFFQH
jgi:hypothetical protein